jgi:hypothetical protein
MGKHETISTIRDGAIVQTARLIASDMAEGIAV